MIAACACGKVELEASGAPILVNVCYCDDCQEGARRIEALPGAGVTPDVGWDVGGWRTPHPSTAFRPFPPSSRRGEGNAGVASCCNSAMYLDFEKGHWLSIYRRRFRRDMPAVSIRIQTKYRPGDAAFPDDAPAYPGFPFRFLARHMGARIAMLPGR